MHKLMVEKGFEKDPSPTKKRDLEPVRETKEQKYKEVEELMKRHARGSSREEINALIGNKLGMATQEVTDKKDEKSHVRGHQSTSATKVIGDKVTTPSNTTGSTLSFPSRALSQLALVISFAALAWRFGRTRFPLNVLFGKRTNRAE